MAAKKKPVLDDDGIVAELDGILARAEAKWPENPGRLAQLRQHVTTSKMAIEHLAAETPYAQGD